MIVTNRRIVQNIIERLQGINRNSSFRTAYLDGTQLIHRLQEHPQVIDKYFGEVKEAVSNLGTPIIITDTDPKSRYSVSVALSSPDNDKEPITINAILDTGATMTVMPKSILEKLGLLTYSYRKVWRALGGLENAKSFFVDARIETIDLKNIEVLALDIPYGLIGQDILKDHAVLLDGPNGVVKLWPRKM